MLKGCDAEETYPFFLYSLQSYRAPVNIDDSEGHYIVREGNLVAGRCE
jgi:hypothetical protein